ncbi:MAG: 2-C-methyl-D-erythritol 4-phosphate cytidylyltransferase, partial [Bacteroidota bacterium]
MEISEYALIVAGGKGTRIKSKVAKQFLELRGLPILMHTIQAFRRYSEKVKIILVLPEDDFGIWTDLCAKHDFRVPVILQKGGETRFQSVKNGLNRIDEY